MGQRILKIKLNWTGFQGAPGVSNFYFSTDFNNDTWEPAAAEYNAAATQVRTFANDISPYVAKPVVLQVDPEILLLDSGDGAIVRAYSGGPQGVVQSTAPSGSAYAAAAGTVVQWKTIGVRKRRRVSGKTFLVPLVGSCFDADGTLNATNLGAMQTAANKMVVAGSGPRFGVWTRPTRVKDANGKYTGEVLPDGGFYNAESAKVADMAAVLRSRRN